MTTRVGKISVYIRKGTSDELPVIFLHGIYFDHHLWDKQADEITDRTVISVDMPLHGGSRENIKPNWTLDDCAEMLVDILDGLQLPKVVAIGHSWGSMTILRAAYKYPERFASLGLCNMSILASTKAQKVASYFQHSMLVFRKFYRNQSARSLFGKTSLNENPALIDELTRPMSILSNKDIQQVDKAVLTNAGDTTRIIGALNVKAVALRGEEDFVPTPPKIETIIVKGGHVSPLEAPLEVSDLIKQVIQR